MMKAFLLSGLLLWVMTTVNAQIPTAADFPKLHWLEGTWIKKVSRPGRTGLEQWEQTSAAAMKGIGVTMKDNDTLFKEGLQLLVKDNALYYVADVAENKGLVWFKITAIAAGGFTCENPAHDFPQKIVYQKTDEQLKVTISGEGKSIDFFFGKKP
ncbi:hypothetical protein SAMN04488128_106146 [Chitinophaga eiseniae]|uniref:DUF6265 domain-containing protein n=1 Tax=Chitinophaga eiseniae TaxID=634771 RepID=A0A1T4TS43_9BACT|nr:DUF6265 family protein [Chitinophaga eiseniae]SKA43237.1 hypothetical protein SAMN04488128_106146 [Chitinophaga eiseniae]